MLFQTGALSVRRLTEADIPQLAKWMSDPRVLKYFGGRNAVHDEVKIREDCFSDEIDVRCMIELDGAPIGYIQLCPSDDGGSGYASDKTVWGIDLYIGEPDYWNRGLGTRVVRAAAEFLIEVGWAQVVTIDPEMWNVRAVRSYEKAGFRKVRFMPQCELHEGVYRDSWLMVFGLDLPFRIERLNSLPIDAVEPLAREAEAQPQPLTFMRRLINEYASGVNRFDQPGEAMFGAYAGDALVGFAGLNIDPYAHHPRVGRVRHVYVLASHRRSGAGRAMLLDIISVARPHFDLLRLRTNTAEGPNELVVVELIDYYDF